MSNNPLYHHCENPNCDYVYNIKTISGNSRKCSRCKGNFCVNCKKQVFGFGHEALCKIEDMKKNNAEDLRWLNEHTTPCPRCFIRIEKNKGCNHVVCPKCATHFCFLCKEEIVGLPVDHYKNPNKICYQKYLVDAV